MSAIPLNARTFLRNIVRDEADTSSLVSAGDLSGPEVEEIYRRIDEQDARNAEREAALIDDVSRLRKSRDEYPATPEGLEKIRSGNYFGGTFDPMSLIPGQKLRFIPDNPDVIVGESELSDDERLEINLDAFNKDVQSKLDDAILGAESFEETRGKTSVGYAAMDSGHMPEYSGPKVVESVVESFTSPAYNINTTLGRFNAFKNEDGTVTIRDTYDWTGTERQNPYKEIGDMGLWEFIKIIPIMVTHPEAAGNVIMRTLKRGKSSPIEFTLPPRNEDLLTEMPEGYREGGRVRLL